jgi:hypothetical protein
MPGEPIDRPRLPIRRPHLDEDEQAPQEHAHQGLAAADGPDDTMSYRLCLSRRENGLLVISG